MRSLPEILDGRDEWRIVITDSGLGGLWICARLERRLRAAAVDRPVRLIYVNAWPDPRGGYNDMPDAAARVRVFGRALSAMTAMRPGLILLACNTLSVLFDMISFARGLEVPVAGIIDEGVRLFARTLSRDPSAKLALFGTRTTIESGEHVRRLTQAGIRARRVVAAACHGLAGAIDKDPDAPGLAGLVEDCVSRALKGIPIGGRLYAGLCCTHYSFVADLFRRSLEQRVGSEVGILDPGENLVASLTAGLGDRGRGDGGADVTVEVISKVELDETQRRAVAGRLEPVSAPTAEALVAYTLTPGLF